MVRSSPHRPPLFRESLRFSGGRFIKSVSEGLPTTFKRRKAARCSRWKEGWIKNGRPWVPPDVSIGRFGVGSVCWNGSCHFPELAKYFLSTKSFPCLENPNRNTRKRFLFLVPAVRRGKSNLVTARYSSNFAEKTFCDSISRLNFVFHATKIMEGM